MRNYGDDPDVDLMLRVANGDRHAFEQLVLKYQRSVINTAYRYTGNPSVAEDLAQDVFVRVYRAASTYRPDARFSTWLFTIVRNICSNYRSREGKHDPYMDADADADSAFPQQETPEDSVVRKELQQQVRNAIRDLPDSLRMPLILNHFNQMQYEEVAQVLNLSLGAVKVRIHRAKLALAEKLKDFV